jgi:hypothetical protein
MPPKKELKQKKNRPTNLFLPVEEQVPQEEKPQDIL